MDDYAGDIIDLLDGLHVEDAVVGGLSMGGYVAFALLRHAAALHPRRWCSPTHGRRPIRRKAWRGGKQMLALVREKGPAAVADEMMPKLLGESTRRTRPDVVERSARSILANSAEAIASAITALMTRPDSTPLLAIHSLPTLIVVGEQDTITPPAMSEEMHRGDRRLRARRHPGAGHLSNLEQPEAFNAALARFLEHRV